MSDTPNPAHVPLDQLRRRFIEQATTAFDRMFAARASGEAETREQREQLAAREFAQQLTTAFLQEECQSEDGFLQDIFTHPEDDTPRLIYADWLEENHQPARAQFIRLQCRLAKLDPEDPERELLHHQECERFKDHGAVWKRRLPVWAREVVRFERGFVNHLTLSAEDYLRRGKRFRQQAPIDSLNLSPLRQTDRLLDSGLLSGIRHLGVSGTEDELLRLLRSEQVAGLESVGLGDTVSEEVCRALASNRHFGRLRRLTFGQSQLGPAHAAILSQAPLLANLEELAILEGYGRLGVEGVRVLGRSPHWGRLKKLSLAHTEMGPEAVRELVQSPMVKGVTSLSLTYSAVQEAVRDLALSPHLKDLIYLNLHGSEINDEGLEALGQATQLPRLISLNLYNNPISAEGIAAFSRGSLLGHLQRLVLGHVGGGTDSVKNLAESPGCQQLRCLTLDYFQVGPEDAAALAASPYLPRLTTLSLEGNDLEASGALALAAATNLPALRYLSVGSNKIGSEAAEALAASPLGRQLERLDLGTNRIPVAFRQQLAARFGRRVTV